MRSGLTLLELMMVLVILAVVSTIAIQSLQPQVENQRFQAATRLLSELETATVGPRQKYQLDGTPLISGFVSDVGRLPRLVASAAENPDGQNLKLGLAELWDLQSGLAVHYPFQFRAGPKQPKDFSDVRLACGWRGPYLQLAAGMRSLKDPWGQSPSCTLGDSGDATAVHFNLPPKNDQLPEVLTANLATGKVQLTGKVVVSNPQNATIQVVALVPAPDSSLTSLVVLDDEDPQSDTFSFSHVPVGIRAIVAEVGSKRYVRYFLVPHGGLNVVLDLQNEADASTQ